MSNSERTKAHESARNQPPEKNKKLCFFGEIFYSPFNSSMGAILKTEALEFLEFAQNRATRRILGQLVLRAALPVRRPVSWPKYS